MVRPQGMFHISAGFPGVVGNPAVVDGVRCRSTIIGPRRSGSRPSRAPSHLAGPAQFTGMRAERGPPGPPRSAASNTSARRSCIPTGGPVIATPAPPSASTSHLASPSCSTSARTADPGPGLRAAATAKLAEVDAKIPHLERVRRTLIEVLAAPARIWPNAPADRAAPSRSPTRTAGAADVVSVRLNPRGTFCPVCRYARRRLGPAASGESTCRRW